MLDTDFYDSDLESVYPEVLRPKDPKDWGATVAFC